MITAVAGGAVGVLLVLLASGMVLFPEGDRVIQNRTVERYDRVLFSVETARYPANVSLVSPSGNLTVDVSIEGWNLNFGTFRPGDYARRFLELGNPAELPAKVTLFSTGNISAMVRFSESAFILEPGERRNLSVLLNGSRLAGNYSGVIGARIVMPRFREAAGLLRWVI